MASWKWKLTVRNGAEVSHEKFADLDAAVARMRERALEVRSQAPPKTARMLRTFGPEQQVQGRVQLSGRGVLRRAVAGVDVRGDGSFVAYRGRVGREEIDAAGQGTPFDAVRETLGRA